MNELFLQVLNMSISASWLIIAVLIFRLILRKAPKWIHVLLWGIVAIRLICPFSIKSAFSLIPSSQTIPKNIEMELNPAIDSGIPAINNVVNPVINQAFVPDKTASLNPLQIWITIFAFIWIIGMVIMIFYIIASYMRLNKKVYTAVLYRDNIFCSENIVSPFVLGVINPKIYIPFNLDDKTLEYVLAHEKAHIKRKDNIWKFMGFIILIIYWFNPLVWLSYILLCRDIELACDEKVIKSLDNEQRADYTEALVMCSIKHGFASTCPLAFGEIGVKERVKSVMKYKKTSFWVIIISVVLLIIIGLCFLTNPSTQDKEDNSVYIDYTQTVQSNVPNEVVDFAKEYIQEYIIHTDKSWKEIGDKNDLPHITDAKIIALTQIDTKAERTNEGEELWKLEYRLKVDGNIASIINGGMSEEDGWITEWSSSGQPYLIVHWENVNGQIKWELVDAVGDEDIINYNTPQMLQKYGDKYTATVREKYISNQNYNGEIIFYSQQIKEFEKSTSISLTSFKLSSEQTKKIKEIIANIDNWTNDELVDRLDFYFDGEINLDGIQYYFSFSQNIIYYDHYFSQIEEQDMQYIKSISEQ